MGLFRRRESRSISFQDVWGSGGDWTSIASPTTALGALKLSAVVACVNLRANLLSQLPMAAYVAAADGSAIQLDPQPMMVSSPSRVVPRSLWLRQASISRDLWGNAVGLIVARDGLTPTQIEWVDPASVSFGASSGVGQFPEVRVNGTPVAPDAVLLWPSGTVLPGSPVGIAPLMRSGLVELGRRAQEFARDWFVNGAVPSVVAKVDHQLTQEQADEIKTRIVGSWRTRHPAVIGSGISVEAITARTAPLEVVEVVRQAQVEVCQVFGVPPEEIGIAASGSSVTYANREQRAQSMLVNWLNADLAAFQELLTAQLPAGQFVRFNTGALLRSDLAARYASYEAGIRAGFLTIDEVRELEERRPLAGTSTEE